MDSREKLKEEVRSKVMAALPIGFFDEHGPEEVRVHIEELVNSFLPWHKKKLSEDIAEEIISEFVGFGILEPLIADPMISEIMINGYDKIFIEKAGKIEKADMSFKNESDYAAYAQRLVDLTGKRINELEPLTGGRLPDGSRLNVVIPPIVDKEPVVTIRKFWKKIWDLDELVSMGSVPGEMLGFLKESILNRKNILIAGAAGVGKTTLANALATYIPEGERVVVIEDITELFLAQENVVHMETRPANVDGRGEVSLRRLISNALHMRPDRLILGEILGEEALDVLQAMNTGHSGSMCTIHANSIEDALSRLETLVYMGGMSSSNPYVVGRLIGSAVDMLIFMRRDKDGQRLLQDIAEIYWDEKATKLSLKTIYSRA